MEHRQHAHDRILGMNVEVRSLAVDLLGDTGHQTLVCEHHPFWQTGGSRGVWEANHVVRVDLHFRALGLVCIQEHRNVEAAIDVLVDDDYLKKPQKFTKLPQNAMGYRLTLISLVLHFPRLFQDAPFLF